MRLTAAYLIGVLSLSSIDVTYDWFSPLVDETGQSTDWCVGVGLKAGALVSTNHDGSFPSGLVTDVHLPQFLPSPFFVAVGPGSGVVAITVWFLGLVAWAIHLLVRLGVRRFRDARFSTARK